MKIIYVFENYHAIFDVGSYSRFIRLTLGRFHYIVVRSSVIRGTFIRCWVVLGSFVRCWVVRGSVGESYPAFVPGLFEGHNVCTAAQSAETPLLKVA